MIKEKFDCLNEIYPEFHKIKNGRHHGSCRFVTAARYGQSVFSAPYPSRELHSYFYFKGNLYGQILTYTIWADGKEDY